MSDNERILLVEDDEAMRTSCREVLESEGFGVLEAGSPREAEPLLLREEIGLVVTDLRMPGGGGAEVLRLARGLGRDLPVVLVTAYPSVESAIDAFKGGVTDYLLKPFTGDQLVEVVKRAISGRRARERAEALRRSPDSAGTDAEIIGSSARLHEMLAEIRRIAPAEGAVLILGETGSGKELAARAVHRHSRRAGGPFVVLNCAALPQTLLEAELFGYEKGAFTGAEGAKPGLLEAASGGTLFMDEAGDLALESQAKILRCIEEKSCRRVGGVNARPVDIRLITATNKDLREEVRGGRFREDLFFRLAVHEVRVPPLRERVEDIPRLAVAFLDRSGGGEGGPRGFTEGAIAMLKAHPWPGNIRELQNAVQRAAARCVEPLIREEHLEASGALRPPGAGNQDASHREEAIAQFERHHLADALAKHGGNVTHAAQALGIHRTTLQRLMRKYGVERP